MIDYSLPQLPIGSRISGILNRFPFKLQDVNHLRQMAFECVPKTDAPSSACKPSNFTNNQEKVMIMCNRPTDHHVGTPPWILHPAFNQFLKDFKSIQPDHDFNNWILSFVSEMSKMYLNEAERDAKLNQLLSDILGYSISNIKLLDGSTNDGIIFSSNRRERYCMLIKETKNEIGNGGCDPFLQASYSYSRAWSQKDTCHSLKCPSFLLSIAGPFIMVSAACLWNGSMIPVTWSMHSEQLQSISRLLAALKNGLNNLRGYYHPETPPSTPEKLSPFYTQLHSSLQPLYSGGRLEYTEQLSRTMFKADLHSNTALGVRKVIVKFADKYCKDAHIACTAEFSPIIYCADHETIDGCCFVVMEELEGYEKMTSMQPRLLKPYAKEIYDKIEGAVSTLHRAGYVHGDLRGNNIMIKIRNQEIKSEEDRKVDVKLIDFDWAGRPGVDKYPPFMNHKDIQWPAGASDIQPLEFLHDIEFLDRIRNWLDEISDVHLKRSLDQGPGTETSSSTSTKIAKH